MAPNAQFYVSVRDVEGVEGLGWFISQNCDIVNCSFAGEDNLGYKYNFDAIYDYQVKAHWITLVAGAGNKESYNEDREVTSPGCAINAITVGGVNCFWGDWRLANDSAYVYPENDFAVVKPNIVAPFTINISNFGRRSGTSFSAPLVTGCIALFMDINPGYLTAPERILSLITATSQETSDYSNDIGAFDDGVGAGMINLDVMLYASSNCNSTYNTNSSSGTEIRSYSVSLSAGDDIQIALAWLIDVKSSAYTSGTITANHIYVTDYDIYLYDPYGNVVDTSQLEKGNVELIRWTVTSSGTYRIGIYQASAKNSNNSGDPISLTYCIT